MFSNSSDKRNIYHFLCCNTRLSTTRFNARFHNKLFLCSQPALSQLLRDTEEVEAINALEDFGRRIEPLHRQTKLLENQSELDPVSRSTQVRPKVNRYRYKIPIKLSDEERKPFKKPIYVPDLEDDRRREGDDEIVDNQGNREIMISEESNAGFSKFSPAVKEQETHHSPNEVGKSRRRGQAKFGGKRHEDDVMMIPKRGQRQSLSEEMAHSHIHRLDINCNNDGISVSLEFNSPFDGVVYSKGHFNDPRCT